MLPDGSKSTDEKNIPKPKRKSKKDKSMMAKSHLAADDDEIATISEERQIFQCQAKEK